jgi:hypothetical protein
MEIALPPGMKTTKSERNWVVVVTATKQGRVYLGELEPGLRQGVMKLENATRFTQRGAMRVLNGYPSAKADGSAYAMQLPYGVK